jgi:UDPglucose 6-dehydrogenase
MDGAMNVTMLGAERDCRALGARWAASDNVVTYVVPGSATAHETIARADAAVVVSGRGVTMPEEELRQIVPAADAVGRAARRELVLVLCGVLPVGGADLVTRVVDRHASVRVHVCYVPRMPAVDHTRLDRAAPRIIVGADSDHARSVITELYAPLVREGASLFFMDLVSAEVARVALGAGRETARPTLHDDLAGLCAQVGANADRVRRAVTPLRRGRTGARTAADLMSDPPPLALRHVSP